MLYVHRRNGDFQLYSLSQVSDSSFRSSNQYIINRAQEDEHMVRNSIYGASMEEPNFSHNLAYDSVHHNNSNRNNTDRQYEDIDTQEVDIRYDTVAGGSAMETSMNMAYEASSPVTSPTPLLHADQGYNKLERPKSPTMQQTSPSRAGATAEANKLPAGYSHLQSSPNRDLGESAVQGRDLGEPAVQGRDEIYEPVSL